MQTRLTAFTSLSILVLALTACQDSALDKAPGTYQKTTTSTDANGTAHTHSTTTDVSVDSQGKKKAVVKSKNTTDPKGLFNKTTNSNVEVDEQQ